MFSAWKRFDLLFPFSSEYKIHKRAQHILHSFNREARAHEFIFSFCKYIIFNLAYRLFRNEKSSWLTFPTPLRIHRSPMIVLSKREHF